MKLYEITQRMRETLAALESDPLNEEAHIALMELDAAHDDKVRAVIGRALELEAQIAARKDAIKRMEEANERDASSMQWLMEYAKESMRAVGHKHFECLEFKATLIKNPASVVLLDEAKVPEQYKRTETVTTTKVDKRALADDLKAGVIIEGACLSGPTHRLQIK